MLRGVAFLLLLACSAVARSQDVGLGPDTERQIDSLFEAFDRPDSPGYAVGVVKEGKLIFGKGYGQANLDYGIPITSRSAFHLASLSKQFTGAAIALLVLDGRISLADPVAEYVPEVAKYGDGLRIEHLVYMTSGLHEYYRQPRRSGLPWQTFYYFTTEEAIDAALRPDTLRFVPGSQWEYSNTNYMLLTRVVERVSGLRFTEFLRERVFVPLGMEATHVNDDPTLIVPNRAVGYSRRSADLTREAETLGLYVRDQPGWLQLPRIAPHYGGSGVLSTLEDLARWDANFYTGALAGPAFTELMGQRKRFGHDKDNDALGLYWDEFEGRPLLAYDGSDVGVSSYMARFPEQQTTVIVLSNISSEHASERAHELMRVLVDGGAL